MDKNEIISKLENANLSEEQLLEISSVIIGETTDRHLINKAEKIFSDFFKNLKDIASPNVWLLIYRLLTLFIIVSLIYLLAIREPENSTQVWTIVGAFIGFIFGQKSSFLRF